MVRGEAANIYFIVFGFIRRSTAQFYLEYEKQIDKDMNFFVPLDMGLFYYIFIIIKIFLSIKFISMGHEIS
jgi:hypothetical protein